MFAYYVYTTHPQNLTMMGLPQPTAFYPLLHEFLSTTLRGLGFRSSIVFGADGKVS